MAAIKSLRHTLAANLRAKMALSPGLDTQLGLSKRSGVAQSFISLILREQTAATLDTLQALSKALGCQPWELLIDDEAMRREAVERILGPPTGPPKPKHRPEGH